MSTVFCCCVQCECRNETDDDGSYYRTQCAIRAVPSDVPSGTQQVHLDNNSITSIEAGAFSHLLNCTYLSLSQNLLTKINQQMFFGLTSVRRLLLDNNKIFYIAPGTFTILPSLVHVQLANNSLTLLPADVFGVTNTSHPTDLRLSMGGNPLVCNHRFTWMKKGEDEGWLTLDFESLPECTNYREANWRGITSEHLKIGFYDNISIN